MHLRRSKHYMLQDYVDVNLHTALAAFQQALNKPVRCDRYLEVLILTYCLFVYGEIFVNLCFLFNSTVVNSICFLKLILLYERKIGANVRVAITHS
uniref:BUB1 N-terminal domain-containing protein n=1 Tax=Ascaris lumbricoides TaxID=6252 RepID=A0A0M3IC78_ASCLU